MNMRTGVYVRVLVAVERSNCTRRESLSDRILDNGHHTVIEVSAVECVHTS